MKSKLALAVAAGSLVIPAFASAHVTIKPEALPAGGYARIDVRVPNESDKASTDRVEVQMPDGFAGVSYAPVPGWETDVKTSGTGQQVDTITWTAAEGNGGIAPGQFQDFGLSVKMPDSPGETLTFPAVQSYSDGEVVRWIGSPDSEEPAPTVALGAPAEDGHGATAPGDDQTLVIIGLVAAVLALILAAVALLRRG